MMPFLVMWGEYCYSNTIQSRQRARIVDFHLDRSFNESNLSCKWSRSSISFGGPFSDLKDDGSRVFDNIASSRGTQIDRMKSWVMDEVIATIDEASEPSYSPDIQMTWFMASISFDVILDLLLTDALLAIISIVVVFSYLWLITGSSFLAIIGMSGLQLCIPPSFPSSQPDFLFSLPPFLLPFPQPPLSRSVSLARMRALSLSSFSL